MDRASTSTLREPGPVAGIENTLLFVDDDLRETGLALTRIEAYLVRTLDVLQQDRLSRAAVHAVAVDTDVLDHLDVLNETLESLRRRMARLASRLRK